MRRDAIVGLIESRFPQGAGLPVARWSAIFDQRRDWPFMILRTVEQVRRIFRIVAGFTLLLVGVVMIVTPGPGWLVILLGLGLLAAEFVWARRLMDRLKREGDRLRETVLGLSFVAKPGSATGTTKKAAEPAPAESTPAETVPTTPSAAAPQS